MGSKATGRCANSAVDVILDQSMERINSWKIEPGSLGYPMVVAHRGSGGLAPENTLAAFRRVVEMGVDAIELDVRLTRDGEVAVIHDRRLDRTTTGKGPVGAYTLDQLKSLDAGSWFSPHFRGERVPVLEEVFEAVPDGFPVYVEIKARGPAAWPLAAAVIRVLRNYDRWDSTLVASFNPMAMALVRVIEPRIVRGYIWSRRHPLPLRARWLSPLVKPNWYAPDRRSTTPELVAKLHSQGKPVAAWDVDTGTDMTWLKAMGLDAIVTDHPDVLLGQKYGTTRKRLDQVHRLAPGDAPQSI